MIKQTRKINSIYIQMIKLLMLAALLAIVALTAVNRVGDHVLGYYLEQSGYLAGQKQKYIDKFQQYVQKNNLSTENVQQLNAWIEKQKILSIQVYKNDILVFDSDYPEQDVWNEDIAPGRHTWEKYYEVAFSDGAAEITITGFYDYRIYDYVFFAELILAFGLFLFIVLRGIQTKMKYIELLSREIEILEGGALDYAVTVNGKDELAELAQSIEQMRLSFQNLLSRESELIKENQKIVTEMSHDLRTPVTAIMLYTEIIKSGKYKENGQLDKYVDKIQAKAQRIKQLTDSLFTYTLTSGENIVKLDEAESCKTVFYDIFSETCNYLEQRGFRVVFQAQWTEEKLQVSREYVVRIMDNITSNIMKYADPYGPVFISLYDDGEFINICFENRILYLQEKPESTEIGIQSVRNMMKKMGGECTYGQLQGMFRMELRFAKSVEV